MPQEAVSVLLATHRFARVAEANRRRHLADLMALLLRSASRPIDNHCQQIMAAVSTWHAMSAEDQCGLKKLAQELGLKPSGFETEFG